MATHAPTKPGAQNGRGTVIGEVATKRDRRLQVILAGDVVGLAEVVRAGAAWEPTGSTVSFPRANVPAVLQFIYLGSTGETNRRSILEMIGRKP